MNSLLQPAHMERDWVLRDIFQISLPEKEQTMSVEPLGQLGCVQDREQRRAIIARNHPDDPCTLAILCSTFLQHGFIFAGFPSTLSPTFPVLPPAVLYPVLVFLRGSLKFSLLTLSQTGIIPPSECLPQKKLLIIFILLSNSPGDSRDQLDLGLVGTGLVSWWGQTTFCHLEFLSVLISHVHDG